MFRAIPAPLRTVAEKDIRKLIDRYRDQRTHAVDICTQLPQHGLAEWRIERVWQRKMRRRRYEYFVMDSTYS